MLNGRRCATGGSTRRPTHRSFRASRSGDARRDTPIPASTRSASSGGSPAPSPAAGRHGLPRVTAALAGAVALSLVLALLPAAPAEATTVRTFATERLLGGVSTQKLEIRLNNGSIARGNLVRFQEDDPQVELRSRLARGTVAGLEGMQPLTNRALAQGGIAGINGGYFMWNSQQIAGPIGAPNGLFVDRGRLEQGQAVNRSGNPTGRAVVGWQRSGRMVMDRVLTTHAYDRVLLGGEGGVVSDLNRQPWRTSQVLLYTDRFGTSVNVPAGAAVVTLDGLRLRSTGRSAGEVVRVRQVVEDVRLSVPDGQHLLVATGNRAAEFLGVGAGEVIGITTTMAPEAGGAEGWDGLFGGVAGGQLLVRGGTRRPADEWTDAASFDTNHVSTRRARTAIGRTDTGRILLVTIDERNSAGVTMRELADTMIALGARDAVNLDGGGSTTFVVNGQIRNTPSQTGRAVADGLFVHVPLPEPARSLATACDNDLVLAGSVFLDVAGTTHARAIGCLTGWGVTNGVTLTSYQPTGQVTRAQMASFLARWIDDHAERGSGNGLPRTAPLRFTDVRDSSVHATAIARLSAAGIIQGTSATTFRPSAPVTRGQTASLMARAMDHVAGTPLPRGRDTFSDDNGNTHEPNIDRLAATGVLTGVGGFSFRPGAAVTRGAMASILMRGSAKLVDDGIGVPPGTGPIVASTEP